MSVCPVGFREGSDSIFSITRGIEYRTDKVLDHKN